MKPAPDGARTLLAGLLLAVATPAAAQTPTLRNPFDLLRQNPPRLELHSGFAVLHCCASERRVDMQVQWPAVEDASPAALVLEGGFLASGPHSYSRGGIAGRLTRRVGRVSVAANAGAGVGSGDGPRQQWTMAFSGAIPWLVLDLRSTWFSDAPVDTVVAGVAVPVPGGPSFVHGNYTDGELTASHSFATGLRLLMTGGLRFGGGGGTTDTPPQWLWSEVEMPVRHGLSVLLSGGVRPRRPDLAQPGGRFAKLGFRFALGEAPPAPVTVPAPDTIAHYAVTALAPDRYLLRLHVPHARAVELKGDVTDWETVAMRRAADSPSEWETELVTPPGLYHISISVDGGPWIVPEGLAPVPDGFGGATGLLTLQPAGEAEA